MVYAYDLDGEAYDAVITCSYGPEDTTRATLAVYAEDSEQGERVNGLGACTSRVLHGRHPKRPSLRGAGSGRDSGPAAWTGPPCRRSRPLGPGTGRGTRLESSARTAARRRSDLPATRAPAWTSPPYPPSSHPPTDSSAATSVPHRPTSRRCSPSWAAHRSTSWSSAPSSGT